MAQPTTRAEFKEWCKRKLGYPVIEINVSDDQIDDRVDEALSYFWDYHFDGSTKEYYKWQITAQNVIDRYLVVPEEIIGVVKIFDLGGALSSNNLFSIRYQIALNDMYNLTSLNGALTTYYMTMQHVQALENLLIGQQPIRYNRHVNKLYLDMDWEKVAVGEYIICEAYQVVDPDTYVDVWKDRWLQSYAAEKIKYQWGSNLTKFTGMVLPGGTQFNGENIMRDAQEQIEKLEHEMLSSYSLPISDMIG